MSDERQQGSQGEALGVDLDLAGLPLDEQAKERVKDALKRALEDELAGERSFEAEARPGYIKIGGNFEKFVD